MYFMSRFIGVVKNLTRFQGSSVRFLFELMLFIFTVYISFLTVIDVVRFQPLPDGTGVLKRQNTLKSDERLPPSLCLVQSMRSDRL